jgi:hypothetical protein
MRTQALILKTFPYHEFMALVLDEKYGKIYVRLSKTSDPILCQGMLITGTLHARSNSARSLLCDIDPLYAPFEQACHDIEFLHTFLFILQQSIPLHALFSDIILYTQYVYSVFFQLQDFQKKIVLLYICLKVDVFPQDPWLYRLVLEHAYGAHELCLDERAQQKVSQAFAACWKQISFQK